MDVIAVADLETYWINFEQLLRRWNATKELVVSYCVCVDISKGNPPLIPHFYQGQFSAPNGNIQTRLVKYEAEYKNAGQYLNKTKTEYQLINEFIALISGIPKNNIWFMLSDVAELEAADNSLRFAAQGIKYKNESVSYVMLDSPITFEEIFRLWVGEEKYNEIVAYDPNSYVNLSLDNGFDDYLNIIRQVEIMLDDALKRRCIHLYMKSAGDAGRIFFFECRYDQGELFSKTREGYGKDGLHKCFQFMTHYPNIPDAKSEPLYFDRNEIFTHFPFLMPHKEGSLPLAGQATPAANEARIEPSHGWRDGEEKERQSRSPAEATPSAQSPAKLADTSAPDSSEAGNRDIIAAWEDWIQRNRLSAADKKAAKAQVEEMRGKLHREIYPLVCPGTHVNNPVQAVSKMLKRARSLAQKHHLPLP